MRKKIFVIHGSGVNRGIGKEGGGDLDTIGSNALYVVWAKNALREELGREPVYGRDYGFDFINYSEGVAKLAVHRGCDVYLPDFPIDALAPRLKLLVIEDEETVELINELTDRLNDFRRWIIRHADEAGDEVKKIFNATYEQVAKVMEHRERAALLTALNILKITRHLAELDIASRSMEDSGPKRFLESHLEGMREIMAGRRLQELKRSAVKQLGDKTKEKMIDVLVRKEPLDKEVVIGFDRAVSLDMSTKGRVGYSDELVIVATELVAYIVRGLKQLGELPFSEKRAAAFELTLHHLTEDLTRHFRKIANLCLSLPDDVPGAVREAAEGVRAATDDILELIDHIGDYVPGSRKDSTRFPITVMLIEDARAAPVPGIEIKIKRLKGEGAFVMADGSASERETVTVATDKRGAAAIAYAPSSPDEDYLFSVTFDDLDFTILPSEVRPPDNVMELIFDDAENEISDGLFDEKASEGPDRSTGVALTMIERHFRYLKENDVAIVSIDDHHPYTPAVYDLLQKLKSESIIGNLRVASLPRGQELPEEQQQCGTELIYADRIAGKPWDNAGLAELRRIARLQDLHIEAEPLALELSKLIGSKFNKIEMACTLAERLVDLPSLRSIMEATGWDGLVREYEEGLERVLPRTEQILGTIRLHKRDLPSETVHILVGLSPFCNPKKGEVQINVASAINYLIDRKGYRGDYMFYTFGSHLLTTRRPNEQETSLDLSTMCQHIGTKADGGHSGAASCKPASNPAFPADRLDKVGDTNFLEYIEYLGKRVEECSGLLLDGVNEVKAERYTEPVERCLRHVGENTFEMILCRKDNPDDTVKVLFTRAPKINRKVGEEKPSFLQVLTYLKRHSDADYLIFAQGMLYRVVLCAMGGERKGLDLPRLARSIGWSEDGGCETLAIADIRKNGRVKKRLHQMFSPHIYQLHHLLERFIEEGSEYRVVSTRPIFAGSLEDAGPVLSRMDDNTYVIDLVRRDDSGGKAQKLRIVAVLAPSFDKRKGEVEPSLSLIVEHVAGLKPNYLIHSDSRVLFPRTDQVMTLMRVDDGTGSIDCSEAVSVLAGKQFCGDDRVAEFMPGHVESSPLGKKVISGENYRIFLDFMLGKICDKTGYRVERIEKRSVSPQ